MTSTKNECKEWAYSATQLETYVQCPQKYHFEYVEGRRGASSPGAQLGTEVHNALEHWSEHGSLPEDLPENVRALADALIDETEWLYSDGEVLTSEGDLRWRDPETGYTYRARMDLHEPGFVGDYKTTKRRQYALSDRTLAEDLQAIMYAQAALQLDDVDGVGLAWTYVLTEDPSDTPEAFTTMAYLEREEIEEKFKEIRKLTAEAEKVRLQQVEPVRHLHACKMFGGCPHWKYCEGGVLMSFKEKLKQRRSLNPPEGTKPLIEVPPEKKVTKNIRPPKVEAPAERPIGTLYIDCTPLDEPVTRLTAVLDDMPELDDGNGPIQNIRLVEYGRGWGILEVAIAEYLKSTPVDALVISLRSEYGQKLADVLRANAARVICAGGV